MPAGERLTAAMTQEADRNR